MNNNFMQTKNRNNFTGTVPKFQTIMDYSHFQQKQNTDKKPIGINTIQNQNTQGKFKKQKEL